MAWIHGTTTDIPAERLPLPFGRNNSVRAAARSIANPEGWMRRVRCAYEKVTQHILGEIHSLLASVLDNLATHVLRRSVVLMVSSRSQESAGVVLGVRWRRMCVCVSSGGGRCIGAAQQPALHSDPGWVV